MMMVNAVNKWVLLASIVLPLVACSSSSDDDESLPTRTVGPASTEHHPNDSVKTSGHSAVTLANTSFATNQRDFSSIAPVTTVLQVSASEDTKYVIGKELTAFAVDGQDVIARHKIDNFSSDLLVYSLVDRQISGTHKADFSVSGFSFNGVVMTTDGSEDLNFYKIDRGVIADHFFTVKSFQGSKFLSTCYLDHDRAYVNVGGDIWSFPINDSTQATELISGLSFAHVSFSSDENNVYLAVSDTGMSGYSTTIKILDKSNNTTSDWLDLANVDARSILVDAQYVYIADKDNGEVLVYNKHTQNDSGSISVPGVQAIDVRDDKLYAFSADDNSITQYTLTFAP